MTSLKTSEKETVPPALNAVQQQNENAQCQTDFWWAIFEQVKRHICVKEVMVFEKCHALYKQKMQFDALNGL